MAHKASLKRKVQMTPYSEQTIAANSSDDHMAVNSHPNKKMKTSSTSESAKDIGKLLMSKMGYKEGEGLGKHSQGDVNVIPESKQKGRRGLGYELSDIQVDKRYEWSAEKEKDLVSAIETVKWMDECLLDIPNAELIERWWREDVKKMNIDDEHQFCDPIVLKGIIVCKNVFDRLSGDELRKARSLSNPFETIEKGIFQNRAAMKMANLDAAFHHMFTNPVDENGKSLVKHSELLYFADICAGPGGFSEYVLWKKGWHSKGFGFTLKGANDFKLEEFFAGSPESFEPHYGDSALNDGDIFKPRNLISFRDFVIRNSDGQGVHFVMADGGFSVEGQENIQEILSKRLYLCQFLCALAILRPNGSFVCKLFDAFTSFSVGLIYLMYRVFKKVSIHKPNSSRPANSERYIICKWKRSGTMPIEDYLFKLNCHLDYLTKEKSENDIIEVVPIDVLKDDHQFFNYIYDSNTTIGKNQVLFLSKVKAYAENTNLVDARQSELRKECLKYWNVPPKTRIAPSRVDPLSKFKELMSKANSSNEYFAYKPKTLTRENLKDLEYVNGFKCMVLSAENDYQTGVTNSLSNIRGYFLGLGRQHIYYWDGSSSSKWMKFEAKLELPPDTLLYGEQVQELKGEGKAQRRITAFHIIDILFIGGKDYREECFEERLSLANKLAKAVTKTTQTEYSAIRMKRVYDFVNIQNLFNNIDMKECKSGAKKDRLCYDINDSDNRFILPYGLLIINTVKQPWICKWSRSNQKLYYFNMKTGKSMFEFPKEALADFQYTFSSRVLWKWESERMLFEQPISDDTDIVDRHRIVKFINDIRLK